MNLETPPRPVISLEAERAKRAKPPMEEERDVDPLNVMELMIEAYCRALMSQLEELRERRK